MADPEKDKQLSHTALPNTFLIYFPHLLTKEHFLIKGRKGGKQMQRQVWR